MKKIIAAALVCSSLAGTVALASTSYKSTEKPIQIAKKCHGSYNDYSSGEIVPC